jgi:tetratricopeptide (TPR) repeat protein
MQVSFVSVARRVSLTLTCTALALFAGACKADVERDGQPNVDRVRLVDERAAGFLVKAQAAFEKGDVGTALALADSAQHLAGHISDTFLADVNFLRGRVYSELNDPDAARQAYERVLSLVPHYRGAHMNLGNNAFRQGQFKRALGYYEREYEAYQDPRVKIYIGRSYLELGRVDSARLTFEAVIEENDSLAEAHARLAHLYDQNGDVEHGLIYARRALEHQPENPDYRYLVGSMLLRSGLAEQAVEEFRQVVARTPGHSEAYYGLGQAMSRLDRVEEARRFLAIADSLKQIDDGLREYETKTRLYPDDPAAWATYGYALHQVGRDTDAMQAFQTVLHIDPENVEIRFAVANLFMKYREVERALNEYDMLLRQDETFVPGWINAGIALARIGRPDAARAAWEAALRNDPTNEVAREYLRGLPPAN